MDNTEKVLEVKKLKKYFKPRSTFLKSKAQVTKAVDGVSFHILKGETFGLVGESGSGKSTLGRTINGLYSLDDGEIHFNGQRIDTLNNRELRPFKKNIQMIFQDPYSSLNPYMTVEEIISEPLEIHTSLSRKAMREKAVEVLEKVGMRREDLFKMPHEFSGGQRQRIGIARAIAAEPDFIICDEAISALDVSIQAQIINLLEDLQKQYNLTYLFIAHDLSMVRHISDVIGVMYLGEIIETATSKDLFQSPLHPYTKALLSAIPIPDPFAQKEEKRTTIKGELSLTAESELGCKFRFRCSVASAVCAKERPRLKEITQGHSVACHRV